MSNLTRRLSKRQQLRRYAKMRVEHIHTAAGQLYRLLRFLGQARLLRWLMRGQPWHVADVYVGGRFARQEYLFPPSKSQVAAARKKALAIAKHRRG